MKKLLAGAVALGLASCAAGSPAYASVDNDRNRYEQRYDHGKRHGHKKWERRTYRYNYDSRYYRHYNYYNYNYGQHNYYGRYFSRLPSYYPGRCDPYYYVIVRDPYTGRRVCMPRQDYDLYRYQIIIRL